MTRTSEDLTFEGARAALVEALAAIGFDAGDVEPLNLGENAVFWLRSRSVIARVGRKNVPPAMADLQVEVARWLVGRSMPVVRPIGLAQPIHGSGQAVTLWEPVGADVVPGSTADLAALLRQLHALEPPSELALPAADPCRRARVCLERAGMLTVGDREFLNETLDDIAVRYRTLPISSAPVVLHGDANVYNVFRSSDGRVALGDLDTVAIGPPELDLVPTAVYHDRLGWLTEREYDEFVAIYGVDVRGWSGYQLVAQAVELELVAWLAQNAGASPWAAEELIRRMRTLRAGVSRRTWRPFLG